MTPQVQAGRAVPADDPITAQGNTATLLNDFGAKNSAALNIFSSLIGTAADIAGAVGGISAVISIVSSLFSSSDATAQALQDILNAIASDFHELNNDLGAQQILARNTDLNNVLSQPLADYQALLSSLTAQPPLSTDSRIAQTEDCLAALNALNGSAQPDTVWNVDFDWQTYFNDADVITSGWWQPSPPLPDGSIIYELSYADVGYGAQTPPRNPDGTTVFSYIYSFPTYLRAIMLLLAVGGALEADFVTNNLEVLNATIATLQSKHDQIVNQGIKTLAPAAWTAGRLSTLWQLPHTGLQSLDPTAYPTQRGLVPYGATAYFGAVELFSGTSNMTAGYEFQVNTTPPANIDQAMFNKIQLRTLANAKELYRGVGLDQVWEAIQTLKGVVGNTAIPAQRYDSWSFRGEVIPLIGVETAPNGTYSFAALAALIATTPPYESTQRPISLRALLTS